MNKNQNRDRLDRPRPHGQLSWEIGVREQLFSILNLNQQIVLRPQFLTQFLIRRRSTIEVQACSLIELRTAL